MKQSKKQSKEKEGTRRPQPAPIPAQAVKIRRHLRVDLSDLGSVTPGCLALGSHGSDKDEKTYRPGDKNDDETFNSPNGL
jgi:hypothetical protein